MYVYEFQRKAREYLLGQKLSLKSISQKFHKERIDMLKNKKLERKVYHSDQSETIAETQLNSTRGQKVEKAFLIKKSPDHYRAQIEKRKLTSIYVKESTPKRQMSIKEFSYPQPIYQMKLKKNIMQTNEFRRFLEQKRIKTEVQETSLSQFQKPLQKRFQKFLNETNTKGQQITAEHQHQLSGWSVNSNESKF